MKNINFALLAALLGATGAVAAPQSPPNPSLAAATAASAAMLNSMMTEAGNAMHTSMEARSRAAELKIQQGWLDLARQQAADSKAAQQAGGTLASLPANDLKEALLLAHMAHADFEELVPLMQIIAQAFHPDLSKLTMGEYLESLYVVAKYAAFSPVARAKSLTSPPAPAK